MRILQRNLKRTTDTFLFISHTTNELLFKFRCSIFIGVRIIKEMPGLVANGTPYITRGPVTAAPVFLFSQQTQQIMITPLTWTVWSDLNSSSLSVHWVLLLPTTWKQEVPPKRRYPPVYQTTAPPPRKLQSWHLPMPSLVLPDPPLLSLLHFVSKRITTDSSQ